MSRRYQRAAEIAVDAIGVAAIAALSWIILMIGLGAGLTPEVEALTDPAAMPPLQFTLSREVVR